MGFWAKTAGTGPRRDFSRFPGVQDLFTGVQAEVLEVIDDAEVESEGPIGLMLLPPEGSFPDLVGASLSDAENFADLAEGQALPAQPDG